MPKTKLVKNQTNLILVIALALAAVGYYSYRYMLTSPTINKVTTGENGGTYRRKPATPVKNIPKPPTVPTTNTIIKP